MVSGIQMKLRGFSIVEDVHDQWTKMDTNKINETSGNFFTQLLSAVKNFFEYLLRSFDNILPSENPDEPISHWIHLVAKYLAVAVVVILGICCFVCLFSCLVSTFSCLFMCIFSTIQSLFMCIYSTVQYLFMCIFNFVRSLFGCISYIVKSLFRCVSSTVRYIFSLLRGCFCWGRQAAEKLMVAPGRAPLLIIRAVFEADPQRYFADLRATR
ncbi:hypothetical protein CTI12_AA105680 [Artemisia annua]|uniref:Uncharacterized protein n=1 Tax=Artemisia annua TaxID=35608 RepID=A0A2U1P6F9_ARTAN|nr:hypothetical protein CTI12_AA105680 [Artemisia annua]